jgi:hypothetical protein
MAMLSALKVIAASWKPDTITPASLARLRWPKQPPGVRVPSRITPHKEGA